jgi:hypothetical protein
MYGAKIGDEKSLLQYVPAVEAMFPEWLPAEEKAVNLSMSCEHEDRNPEYWATEERHLRAIFDRSIVPRIQENNPSHFSLFALAPQPLLMLLGSLFSDKISVEVYQPRREPKTWKWQSDPDGFRFIIDEPKVYKYPPALIVSISDNISEERIKAVIGEDVSVWKLTIDNFNNDCIKSRYQLSLFRQTVRKLMVLIKEKHGQSTLLKIFPAMPASCAIEFGRIRMPKADMPWAIFDQNNKEGKFIEALKI